VLELHRWFRQSTASAVDRVDERVRFVRMFSRLVYFPTHERNRETHSIDRFLKVKFLALFVMLDIDLNGRLRFLYREETRTSENVTFPSEACFMGIFFDVFL
jgi:hypothetical protein